MFGYLVFESLGTYPRRVTRAYYFLGPVFAPQHQCNIVLAMRHLEVSTFSCRLSVATTLSFPHRAEIAAIIDITDSHSFHSHVVNP